mmetsp:Transcript_64336/g.76165  ORF Transcript_64336/g.76165 Transcript_64336/m.76165 type:complete len:130 (+) Transcript_64336:652-1041(+)
MDEPQDDMNSRHDHQRDFDQYGDENMHVSSLIARPFFHYEGRVGEGPFSALRVVVIIIPQLFDALPLMTSLLMTHYTLFLSQRRPSVRPVCRCGAVNNNGCDQGGGGGTGTSGTAAAAFEQQTKDDTPS